MQHLCFYWQGIVQICITRRDCAEVTHRLLQPWFKTWEFPPTAKTQSNHLCTQTEETGGGVYCHSDSVQSSKDELEFCPQALIQFSLYDQLPKDFASFNLTNKIYLELPGKENRLFYSKWPARMHDYSQFHQVVTVQLQYSQNPCSEVWNNVFQWDWAGWGDSDPQGIYLFILHMINWIHWASKQSTSPSGQHQASWLHQSISLQSCMSRLQPREWKRGRGGEQSWKASSYPSCILGLFAYHSFFFLCGWKQSLLTLNIWNDSCVTILLTLHRLQQFSRRCTQVR